MTTQKAIEQARRRESMDCDRKVPQPPDQAEMDAALERAYRKRATKDDVATIRTYWAKRWPGKAVTPR